MKSCFYLTFSWFDYLYTCTKSWAIIITWKLYTNFWGTLHMWYWFKLFCFTLYVLTCHSQFASRCSSLIERKSDYLFFLLLLLQNSLNAHGRDMLILASSAFFLISAKLHSLLCFSMATPKLLLQSPCFLLDLGACSYVKI